MRRDSLVDKRIKNMKEQPNTIRGNIITWYCSLEFRPQIRIFIIALLTIIVLAHTITFCFLLRGYVVNKAAYPLNYLVLPLLLLVIYPIILIPLVFVIMCIDISYKREGILAWHRDSFGTLFQRFILSLLIMTCVVIFVNCSNYEDKSPG